MAETLTLAPSNIIETRVEVDLKCAGDSARRSPAPKSAGNASASQAWPPSSGTTRARLHAPNPLWMESEAGLSSLPFRYITSAGDHSAGRSERRKAWIFLVY
jgi:hypothetical protein